MKQDIGQVVAKGIQAAERFVEAETIINKMTVIYWPYWVST
jgi:hypothetical protein